MRQATSRSPALCMIVLLISFCGKAYASSTPDFFLQTHQWEQVVIPANSANHTLQSLFGDDLPVQGYGASWIIFRFDAASNRYINPGLQGRVAQGDAFWIIQVTGDGVVLDLPGDVSHAATSPDNACSATSCAEASVVTQPGQSTYSMLGTALATAISLEQTRVRTTAVSCRAGCTLEQASAQNYLSEHWWHYDASKGDYVDLAQTGLVAPWKGMWVQAHAALEDHGVSLLFPAQPTGADPGAEAAARLLAQASFGANTQSINAVRQLGIEAWVDDQFTRHGSAHLDYVRAHPGSGSLSGPRQHKWMIDAIDGDDQLRQRVAFAYSQIFVVSDVSQTLRREQYAMTNYYDILRDNAFGNYRDLLKKITLNPIMGIYLSMLQNGRGELASNTRADENYAREVMQLFTIGPYQLNLDGTIRRDSSHNPLPAYTQQDVEEYARVYTGWTYADADRFDRDPADSNTNKFLPMEQFPGLHDVEAKLLLGGVLSAPGISAEADLDNALDTLFHHPNVGPFIGKQLIKRLVTSNPTPAYVARVAAVFNNNGQGIRGDMRAVIRAILLDTEARSGYARVPNFGKLREPLIRWTHLWRAFNVQRGRQSEHDKYNHRSPYIEAAADFLGQSVLSSPSVFNFYRPDYAPLGDIRDANLTAPEAQIYTDALILTTTEKLSTLTQLSYQGGDDNTLNRSYIDITPETAMASDPGALIDHLNLILMSGQMKADMRAVLLAHMNSLPSDEDGRSQRVRDGIVLIMASPQYLVQK